MRALAVAAAVALALAGCSDGKGGDGPEGGGEAGALPMLHGYVFDPALRPLAGATVKVLDTNASTATDGEGFFGFEGLPIEQFLVVVATLDGYTPSSKQITLAPEAPVRMNFTLEPIPVATPYNNVVRQEMMLDCQVGVVLQDQYNQMACGGGVQAEAIDTWDIAVDPGLSGAVIEVYWDATTQLAESLGAK